MARLVVVSNRVGIPDGTARAGGLEVSIRPALKRRGGVWFGWSGRVADGDVEPAATAVRDNVSYVTIDLQRDDYEEFYNGFANRVLWPILHYRLDLAGFSRRDLSGYVRVNEHFANALSKLLRPDDVVWAHDYHLFPLAKALRERGHQNKIGFFLHTPFPPPDIITALPQHERVISALSHYDLVGFQTGIDVGNFAQYIENECRFPGDRVNGYATGERTMRVGAFPVGIEPESFNRLARQALRSDFVAGVLASLSGRALIIGVDRLDYSKGIPLRLEAFERFLMDHSDWENNVTFLQVTPKSRSGVQDYADLQRYVSEIVGRVNGEFGEAAWTPIRYTNRAHSRSALAGLYRAARAALVTPLRDGMNLVAKEYVAAQDADNPGVLILSRFAGAAIECKPALLVNPYDPDAVGAAINRALSMPLDERRMRQKELFDILSANDVRYWPDRFLSALTGKDMARGAENDGGTDTSLARVSAAN